MITARFARAQCRGVLLHRFEALRRSVQLCALGAAVAARWMGARTLTPAALAGCGTLVGVALCFAFGGGGAELVLYSAAGMPCWPQPCGFCLRQFAPEKPGAGMLLVGAAAAAALGSVQLWQLLPGVTSARRLELHLRAAKGSQSRACGLRGAGAALCAADPALSFAASGLACATAAAAVCAALRTAHGNGGRPRGRTVRDRCTRVAAARERVPTSC
ncbi:MAG: hypothetical protein ACLVJH_17665 [Faecalibacterium prausnitzii]